MFIFGIYLPSDENIENYRHVLNALDALYEYYSDFGSVIIAGDMNASCLETDLSRTNKPKSKELLNFVKRHHLCVPGLHRPNYTFTTKQTMLDYVMLDETIVRRLKYYEILAEGSFSSTSDHLPIVIKLLLDSNPHHILNSQSKQPAWHKISDRNINDYQEAMKDPIFLLLERMNTDNCDIDS